MNPASRLAFDGGLPSFWMTVGGVCSLRVLSIDTSTSAGSILLSQDERVLGEVNIDSNQTHSSRLLSGIDYLLKSTGVELKDLDGLAVINGPGSFTGLRIGLSVVKALAESSGKPVIPVTAFDAWAEKLHEHQGNIIPFLDARRGEVYACGFQRCGRSLIETIPATVDKPDRVLARIAVEEAWFAGEGALQYCSLIHESSHPRWKVVETDWFLGRPLARLAFRRAQQQQFTSARDLQAFYIRKSDAELNWKEK